MLDNVDMYTHTLSFCTGKAAIYNYIVRSASIYG